MSYRFADLLEFASGSFVEYSVDMLDSPTILHATLPCFRNEYRHVR
jgi:hypothetical protein